MWQDKPLILFDWHKTLSFPHQPVHESAIQLLRRLQSEGYALGVLSFASARETQELVLAGVEGVNARLDRPFDVIAVTRTKFIKDHIQSPSISGHSGPKAQLVTELGALVFVDDQAALLSDVRSWQHNLPQGEGHIWSDRGSPRLRHWSRSSESYRSFRGQGSCRAQESSGES